MREVCKAGVHMLQVGAFILRDDQERTIAGIGWAISELRREGKPIRVLVQAPCGAGKTIMSSAMMSGASKKGNSSAFIVRGRQLVFQKSEKLKKCNVPHSILMAGEEYYHSMVTVASVDTYWSRAFERESIPTLDPKMWIVDEAHLAMSDRWLSLIKDADVVVGFTATPAARDGRGMGAFWQKLVKGPTHAELLRIGQLCPCRVFAPFVPDLSQLKLQDGDWSEPAVAKIMGQRELIGDVLRDWKKLGDNRPTACFASSVEHSIALRDEFNNAGIPSAHVDADTPQDERDEHYGAVESGKIKVLCNYGVLTTGFDLPCLGCGILAFATNSVVKYLQVCGRMFRPHPSKQEAILIDHGGNVHRHGWPTEDRDWSLDTSKTIQELDIERREREQKPREPICCPKCGAMRDCGPKCTNCGHEHKRTGLKVRMSDGTLAEIKRSKPKRQVSDRQKTWMSILAACAYRNLPCSSATAIYHRQFNEWPDKDGVSPIPPWEKRGLLVRNVYPNFIRPRKAKA